MKIKKSELNEIIREELEFELLCSSLITEAEEFQSKPKLPPEAENAPKSALQAVIAGYKESTASQDLGTVASNFQLFLKKQGFANPCDYVEDPATKMKLEKDSETLSMQTEKLQALLKKLDTEQVTLEEVIENMEKTASVLKTLTLVSVFGKIISWPAGKYDLIGGDSSWSNIKRFVTPDAIHQLEIPNITGMDTETWGTLGAAMASLWFANAVYRYLLKKGIPCGVAKLFQGMVPVISASAKVAFSVVRGLAKYVYGWLGKTISKLSRRAKLAGGDVARAARKKADKPEFIDPEKLREFAEIKKQFEQIILVSQKLRAVI